ncbi:MAG: tetratricopeptide repeat protein [Pseudomonadales bacterium]
MLLSKKLVGMIVLISVPSMFWQASVSANVVDHYRLPNVLLKAQRAVEKGHPERALELLAGRIDSLPSPNGQAQAYALICQAQYQQQDYASAEKSCDIAANTGRPRWSHFNNRGVMRFMLGRYDEALIDFRQAASIMVSASKVQSRSIRSNVTAAKRRLASR